MADQDYDGLYAQMESAAEEARASAIALRLILGGDDDDTVPVDGFADQPSLAKRVKDAMAVLAASIIAAADATARWQGSAASAPTKRRDNSALQAGDTYFNTGDKIEYVWNSTAWVQAPGGANITALAGLAGAANMLPMFTAAGQLGLLDSTKIAAEKLKTARTVNLGGALLGAFAFDGTTDITATIALVSAALRYIAAVTPAANGYVYFDTDTTAKLGTITSQGRSLIGTSSQATARNAIAAAASGANADITALTALTSMPQISTVPIIDRGSNANGEYIKFADGTLLCTYTVTASVTATTAYASLYYGLPAVWTFPYAFVGNVPEVDLRAYFNTALVWTTRGGAASLTSAQMAILDVSSRTASFQMSYSALGRWK